MDFKDDLSDLQLTGKVIRNAIGEETPYINGYSLDGIVIDNLSDLQLVKDDITTVEDFNVILENRLSDTRSRLSHKGDEYSTKDRLHNFKVCSRLSGESEKKAWRGLFVKHLASIWDMIDGHQKPTKHLINEKIGDAIPYLILLEAILLKEVEDD